MRENGTTGLRGPLFLPFWDVPVETVVLLVKVTLFSVTVVVVFVVLVTGTEDEASTLRFLAGGWFSDSDSELEDESDSELDEEEDDEDKSDSLELESELEPLDLALS